MALITAAKQKNGKPLRDLGAARYPDVTRRIAARYDAASDILDHQNYWANADAYDADSANSQHVRAKLVQRSRYEVGNNGYSDGIAQTYANALVGLGPKLRMQSLSTGFNQMVEAEWQRWTRAVHLRRKLWCQAHAKHVDGEGFGVARNNPGVPHPVKLDYVLHETEQIQSPMLSVNEPGHIDGIEFDQWGNPTVYELLRGHPGGAYYGYELTPERIPARFVMHWFTLRRPGQHRAVPECASTLNVGAASRRWREATIAAAETAADFAALLKTDMAPSDEDAELYAAFTETEIHKRMMTALPAGYDVSQLRSEHPNATYETFHRAQLNEQARPKSMPYNVAACDSSSYNYASGRLDHQTYHSALDVDRDDCNLLVLSPLFYLWLDEAVRVFGWLGGNPSALGPAAFSHDWDWPKHRVADVDTEAKANETRLRTGQVSLSRLYSEAGQDFEDDVAVMAKDYGVTTDEMRAILKNAIFNAQNQQASQQMADQQGEQANATQPAGDAANGTHATA